MRKVHVFDSVSLDGYFTDASGDMSWAHKHDEEWNAFSSGNARGNAELLFGRVTYEMMAAFWPTPEAARMLPQVAEGMNALRKTVFSRTLDAVTWRNTTLVKGDLITGMKRLKAQPGPDFVMSGQLPGKIKKAACRGGSSEWLARRPQLSTRLERPAACDPPGRFHLQNIQRTSSAIVSNRSHRQGNTVPTRRPDL